jgi:hypothetical protein
MGTKSFHAPHTSGESPSQHWHDESAWTVSKMADIAVAYIGLVAADIVLRCAGFHLFHRAVRRCPTRSLKALESAAVRTVCSAVDAAALYYFKEVLCLQKSAVIACLLRMRGVSAQLVIGCRRVPFLAHAWVEVRGETVYGEEPIEGTLCVLERC